MAFQEILETLVDAHAPAVRAAIFCDSEGEKVAAAPGQRDAFDVDVLGATFAQAAARLLPGSRLRTVVADATVWLVVVEYGCYLVVDCAPGGDAGCRSDLTLVAEALSAHM